MKKKGAKARIGILFGGKKIWLSELLSITFIVALLCTLLFFSSIILRNEFISHKLSGQITSLKGEKVVLEHKLQNLTDKNTIASLLCSFAGQNVPAKTIFKLSELVFDNSTQFGYDPILLLAVIHVESVFNPNAQGKFRSGNLSGALGLMQIKLETAQEMAWRLNMGKLTKRDLFKPEINLALGVSYLTTLISRFKNFKLGLLAYNAGPGFVRGSLSRKKPLQMRYYKKVLQSYFELKQLADSSSNLNATTCNNTKEQNK